MNKEKNKGFIIGLIRIFLITVFEIAFIYIWIRDINILKVNPFENKGNWLIAGVYLVELTMLLRVYGGLKIGHLARENVLLSQTLAMILCNMIMAVQIILIVGDMHLIAEVLHAMVLLQLVDFVLSIVMVHLFDRLIRTLYPAKEILLLYGEYSPEGIIDKFAKRKDKYVIKEAVSANMQTDKLKEKSPKSQYLKQAYRLFFLLQI